MDASFSLKFSFNVIHFGDGEEPAILFNKANRADLGYSITTNPNGIYFKVREWGGLYKAKELVWSNAVQPGLWYHVTMVIDRNDNRLKAWVNNQFISESVKLTPGAFICAGRTDLTVGGNADVTFDEVYIYSAVLTPRGVPGRF